MIKTSILKLCFHSDDYFPLSAEFLVYIVTFFKTLDFFKGFCMLEFLRDSLSIYAGTQYIYQDFLNLVMIQILPLECWDYREISLIQFSILSLIQKFFKYSHIVRYCLIFYFHCFIVLGISIKFLSKFELEYILKIRHRILSLYMM